MKTLIFILSIQVMHVCKGNIEESPNGSICVDGLTSYKEYTINNSPCWDEGMNKTITEYQLLKYNKLYQVIKNPQGDIPYCPKKARFKHFEVIKN